MRLSLVFNKKPCLWTTLLLPALDLPAFTGCASIDGTAQGQNLTNNEVSTYMAQSQENVQPADSDSDPGYEWFY